ncbi:MAG: peptidylprolyl isomerase [Planctomycetaceae bacterium]
MIGFALACCVLVSPVQTTALDSVVAKAGEEEITEAQLQLASLLSGHKELSKPLREKLTQRMVETRFAVRYLKQSGFKVNSAEVGQAAKDARAKLKANGVDLRQRMKSMKLTERDLRRELEIRKLWTRYRVKTLTNEVIRGRFEQFRERYDGTRVRASQIFLKVGPKDDAGWTTAKAKLQQLRDRIVAEKISFTDAARKHSQSPSGKQGGDVGRFPYSGLMPRDFSATAFGLKKGEMSQPFRSKFGAHLVMVTDRDKGNLVLEDARAAIYRELEREAWARVVEAGRDLPKAK